MLTPLSKMLSKTINQVVELHPLAQIHAELNRKQLGPDRCDTHQQR